MIYVLEDDDSIRELLVYSLTSAGYECQGFTLAADFWDAFLKNTPKLCILDIMLPDEDGISVLKKIRAGRHSEVPVIMLTAKGSEYDKITGLDAGADDYVAKPFGIMELISRIKAVLRRSGRTNGSDLLTAGPITVDCRMHRAAVAGEEVQLTYKEFALLEFLIKNKGLAFSRDKLLEEVWGYDFEGETRTVDVHIRTLRHKLGQAGELIETVRGVGYRLGGGKF